MPNQQATHGAAGGAGDEAASSPRVSWVYPGGMVGLSFTNYLLRIVTLGLYHFWGKTEVRKRIWSGLRFDGEPLVYTGTGRELFLGFLIVVLLFLLPISIISTVVMITLGEGALGLFQIILFVGFFYLAGVAIYRAQRYRLSRTLWRGIRGHLVGGSWSFGWTYFWTLALPVLLALLLSGLLGIGLGATSDDPELLATRAPLMGGFAVFALMAATWIVPWRATKLQRRLVRDMRFGDRPFDFTAPVGPLYARYAGFWFGAAVLLLALLAISASLVDVDNLTNELDVEGSPMTTEKLKTIGLLYVLLGVGFLVYYLLSAFYRAFQFNHFAAHTHFEGASFRGTATGRGLAWVAFGNFFIWLGGLIVGLIFLGLCYGAARGLQGPLGVDPQTPVDPLAQVVMLAGLILLVASASLFQPIIQARTNGYLARNLAINGRVDFSGVQQGAEQHISRGEGLAQAFDIDAI